MTDQSWRGFRQREQLSGFTRLRAILWRRSVRLAELWALGGRSWYWRLRWHTAREFAGVDPHRVERVGQQEDIFGETPPLTLVKLLELVTALVPDHPRGFVDLGSGRGVLCQTAAFLGYRSTGFEKEQEWVERARRVSAKLGIEVTFHDQDFSRQDWPEPSIFFVVATAFPEELREELRIRFERLGPGSLVVTGDWELGESHLLVWQGKMPVDWGIIPFRVYRAG